MQNISIIRQLVATFIVKYGSNRCKIIELRTSDNKYFTKETLNVLQNIYKQTILPESLYNLNTTIAKYNDLQLYEYYYELLQLYNKYNNMDYKAKKLFYEAYIEPTLNEFINYVQAKYDNDKTINLLLEQVKLELTNDSDYILQYYNVYDIIKLEQENNISQQLITNNNTIQNNQANQNNQSAIQQINETETNKSAKIKLRVIKNGQVNEEATMELINNKPAEIEIDVHISNVQSITKAIVLLAEKLKSGQFDKILNTHPNAKQIKIDVQENTFVYTIYDDKSQILEKNQLQNSLNNKTLLGLLGGFILFTVVFVFIKLTTIIANTIAISVILFTIVLLIMINTSFGRQLLAKILNLARSSKNKTEQYLEYLKIKTEAAVTDVHMLALGFYVLAAGLALLIYKLLGMPIMTYAIIYTIFILINMHSVGWNFTGLFEAIKYILTNFNTAFTKVFGAGSPWISVKIGIVLIFSYVVMAILKKLFAKKQQVATPNQDKMLAEIQAKFR